jgi:hypothetical protein
VKEARIQEKVVKWWRSLGYEAIKVGVVGSFGTQGWPDYMFLGLDGLIFFIEFKATDGDCTPLQLERHRQLRRMGQRVYVCYDAAVGKAICKKELMEGARSALKDRRSS